MKLTPVTQGYYITFSVDCQDVCGWVRDILWEKGGVGISIIDGGKSWDTLKWWEQSCINSRKG